MKKTPLNETEKNSFIDLLSSMSDEDMQEYIKQNGKNNCKDKLFVFQWDNLKPKSENDNNNL